MQIDFHHATTYVLARGRNTIEGNEPSTYQLREPQSVYGAHHHCDMNNLYPWDI